MVRSLSQVLKSSTVILGIWAVDMELSTVLIPLSPVFSTAARVYLKLPGLRDMPQGFRFWHIDSDDLLLIVGLSQRDSFRQRGCKSYTAGALNIFSNGMEGPFHPQCPPCWTSHKMPSWFFWFPDEIFLVHWGTKRCCNGVHKEHENGFLCGPGYKAIQCIGAWRLSALVERMHLKTIENILAYHKPYFQHRSDQDV